MKKIIITIILTTIITACDPTEGLFTTVATDEPMRDSGLDKYLTIQNMAEDDNFFYAAANAVFYLKKSTITATTDEYNKLPDEDKTWTTISNLTYTKDSKSVSFVPESAANIACKDIVNFDGKTYSSFTNSELKLNKFFELQIKEGKPASWSEVSLNLPTGYEIIKFLKTDTILYALCNDKKDSFEQNGNTNSIIYSPTYYLYKIDPSAKTSTIVDGKMAHPTGKSATGFKEININLGFYYLPTNIKKFTYADTTSKYIFAMAQYFYEINDTSITRLDTIDVKYPANNPADESDTNKTPVTWLQEIKSFDVMPSVPGKDDIIFFTGYYYSDSSGYPDDDYINYSSFIIFPPDNTDAENPQPKRLLRVLPVLSTTTNDPYELKINTIIYINPKNKTLNEVQAGATAIETLPMMVMGTKQGLYDYVPYYTTDDKTKLFSYEYDSTKIDNEIVLENKPQRSGRVSSSNMTISDSSLTGRALYTASIIKFYKTEINNFHYLFALTAGNGLWFNKLDSTEAATVKKWERN
jgi:hypothetical protein